MLPLPAALVSPVSPRPSDAPVVFQPGIFDARVHQSSSSIFSRRVSRKLDARSFTKVVISFARRTFTTSPGCRRTIRSPSKATISFSDSMRTSIWLVSGRITGRLFVEWAQIGVTVNFNQIEATAYSAARKDLSNYDFIISGWNDDVTDPAEMMQFVFDYSVTCGYYSGMEFDDEMQQLNSAALIELDEEKRKDLYAQIQQKLRELAIYVPLMVTPWCNAMNKAVTGWVQTPLGNYRLEDLAREA